MLNIDHLSLAQDPSSWLLTGHQHQACHLAHYGTRFILRTSMHATFNATCKDVMPTATLAYCLSLKHNLLMLVSISCVLHEPSSYVTTQYEPQQLL